MVASGKAEHIEQFVAERGIERSALPLATNGTQERSPNRNLVFPQIPKLPLFKEILRILTKLRKVERRTKQACLFFLPRRSTFALKAQSYEKSREEQNKLACFFFRDGVSSPRSGKVTEKREQCKRKTPVFRFALPSASNFGGAKVT
ncbi:MAG: hypothetical protein K5928_01495 [Prevotella sp.]|nr:hypothetical protein [Prevotella sp.]